MDGGTEEACQMPARPCSWPSNTATPLRTKLDFSGNSKVRAGPPNSIFRHLFIFFQFACLRQRPEMKSQTENAVSNMIPRDGMS